MQTISKKTFCIYSLLYEYEVFKGRMCEKLSCHSTTPVRPPAILTHLVLWLIISESDESRISLQLSNQNYQYFGSICYKSHLLFNQPRFVAPSKSKNTVISKNSPLSPQINFHSYDVLQLRGFENIVADVVFSRSRVGYCEVVKYEREPFQSGDYGTRVISKNK